MLTRNDLCFFALAFYRQAVTELFRCQEDRERESLYLQCSYWWHSYIQRRRESRLNNNMSQIRYNVQNDPTYRPYCLRCKGLVRMVRRGHLQWDCRCGAVHDERKTGV